MDDYKGQRALGNLLFVMRGGIYSLGVPLTRFKHTGHSKHGGFEREVL